MLSSGLSKPEASARKNGFFLANASVSMRNVLINAHRAAVGLAPIGTRLRTATSDRLGPPNQPTPRRIPRFSTSGRPAAAGTWRGRRIDLGSGQMLLPSGRARRRHLCKSLALKQFPPILVPLGASPTEATLALIRTLRKMLTAGPLNRLQRTLGEKLPRLHQ